MTAIEVNHLLRTLPDDDDHPYRTGAWRPRPSSATSTTLEVVEGAIPDDLDGVYLRNTENPVHAAIGAVPPVRRRRHGARHPLPRRARPTTATASCAPTGFAAEQEAGGALWAGLAESPDAGQADRRLGRPRAR